MYGNHVVKAHLGRITEDTPEHQGVVVLSMADIPLGFGVSARSTVDTRKLDPTGLVVFHQADVGEYLRDEVRRSFTAVSLLTHHPRTHFSRHTIEYLSYACTIHSTTILFFFWRD